MLQNKVIAFQGNLEYRKYTNYIQVYHRIVTIQPSV